MVAKQDKMKKPRGRDHKRMQYNHRFVTADLNNREQPMTKIVLIINLELKDNHEEAAIGAKLTLELCQKVR